VAPALNGPGMASFKGRNNTMNNVLGVVFAGLVALIGAVAVYTNLKETGLRPVGAQPVNPADVSVEELEAKNSRIEELSAENASLKKESDDLKDQLLKALRDLKASRLSAINREEELQNRVAVLRVTLEANKTELQKALNETQKVLEWETAPKK
jgi:hypothetical protein